MNETVETKTMTDDKQIETAESVHQVVDEENLVSLIDQYSNLMSSTLNLLAKDIDVIINEVASEGFSVEYPIVVQQCRTTALFDTGTNISVMSQKYFQFITTKT